MESTETFVPDLMEIDEELNVFLTQHINDLPKELLIEIFRYIRSLKDRHNAMLVCRFWYELLQDPCFMQSCPEILTIKDYHISVNSEFFKIFSVSNRKFNQLHIWQVYWAEEDDQIMAELFIHLGREIRIIYCDDTHHWIDFLSLFPQLIEYRITVRLDLLTQYTELGPELRSLVVRHLNPKDLDLKLPIFQQIKTLKTMRRLKIGEHNCELLNGIDDNLKRCLSNFCDLKHIRIVTSSNLLRKEPLTVEDIEKIILRVPVQISTKNLSVFPKLRKFSIDCSGYSEEIDRIYSCQFFHSITKCPSIRKIELVLPYPFKIFCKTCMEIMLKSFPNLRALELDNIEYSDPEELLSLLAKNCPNLKVLQLDNSSPYNESIATVDGRPVLGLVPNLIKIDLYNVALDLLNNWPILEHLKSLTLSSAKYPEDISSWNAFSENSPNIEKLHISSKIDFEQDLIPSHLHIKRIVQGFKNLKELNLKFNKLTTESLEPIYTYNRTLKRIHLSVKEDPKPKFKLEHVFELFKRIPHLWDFTLEFLFEERNGYIIYNTTRSDYQLPKPHLAEHLNQYEDFEASIAFIRANLMPNDKDYNGLINHLGSKDLSDVNLYLGIDVNEYMNNNPMFTTESDMSDDEFEN